MVQVMDFSEDVQVYLQLKSSLATDAKVYDKTFVTLTKASSHQQTISLQVRGQVFWGRWWFVWRCKGWRFESPHVTVRTLQHSVKHPSRNSLNPPDLPSSPVRKGLPSLSKITAQWRPQVEVLVQCASK